MLLLLFLPRGAGTINNTYYVCSSVEPDVLDLYVDGILVGRMTSA